MKQQEEKKVLITDLSLPAVELSIKACDDGVVRVYDPLRRKYVACTPEERVRQAFIAHLVRDLGFPPQLMANEVSITLNGTRRRCDTVLYNHEGLAPRLIVEYKAPTVEITQKVFDQIVRYNMVLNVPWLIVSNGMQHFCCRIDYATGTYAFLPKLPLYDEL